jgi:uncharacterized protein YutE (UPF0331/DUF86 family)
MSNSELKSRVIYLHEALRKLSELRKTTRKEFLSDYKISDATLRNLQLVIESLTDIGNYILKRGGQKIPETRVEVFEILCRNAYLDPQLEQDLVIMSRFRNLLVHGYAAIDLAQVYSILQSRFDLLKQVATRLIEVSETFR